MCFHRITVLSDLCVEPQIRPSFCHRSHRHPSRECCWCTHWRFWNFHHLDTKTINKGKQEKNIFKEEVQNVSVCCKSPPPLPSPYWIFSDHFLMCFWYKRYNIPSLCFPGQRFIVGIETQIKCNLAQNKDCGFCPTSSKLKGFFNVQ